MKQAAPSFPASVVSLSSTFGNSTGHARGNHVRISVVIPTYRRPEILRNCLSSLVNQNFNKQLFEIIVVSDGADVTTGTVVDSFKCFHPYIYYFHLHQKKGPAGARNFGWQIASGKLVAFTDDDCLPDPNWLSSFNEVYNNNGSSAILAGGEAAFTGKVKVPLHWPPTDYEKNTSHLETAEFVTANCCCTRSALEKVGGFDERFLTAWREDSDLQFKLLENKIPIARVEDALVIHPVRKVKWGVSISEQKKGIFNALLYKKFPGAYRQRIKQGVPWNYYMIIIAVCCSLAFAFFQSRASAILFGFIWLLLTSHLIVKRLQSTSRTFRHVTEMIITSLIIPFVSVYWHIYGAVRYKVWFL